MSQRADTVVTVSRETAAGPGALPDTPALYEVSIGHTRRAPVRNAFQYRSYMWLVDYEWITSGRRPPGLPGPLRHLARFDPADHLDVRAELAAAGLEAERIVTLTNARVMGYVFNPISVHWCYGPGGALIARVAEVHNTYGGRHAYVIGAHQHGNEEVEVRKEMYVSPFYPVDGVYRMRITDPGPTLAVSVVLERPGDAPFRAGMTGRRRPAGPLGIARAVLAYPLAPLRARALIQWQGIRLWSKGVEVQPR